MELKYRNSESTSKPQTIEIGVSTVYLRKDICRERRISEIGEPYYIWVYQEAKMPIEEFNKNSNIIMLANQQNGNDNQEIIMNALVDIFEAIAMLGG